jgi:hypothetical protein
MALAIAPAIKPNIIQAITSNIVQPSSLKLDICPYIHQHCTGFCAISGMTQSSSHALGIQLR